MENWGTKVWQFQPEGVEFKLHNPADVKENPQHAADGRAPDLRRFVWIQMLQLFCLWVEALRTRRWESSQTLTCWCFCRETVNEKVTKESGDDEDQPTKHTRLTAMNTLLCRTSSMLKTNDSLRKSWWRQTTTTTKECNKCRGAWPIVQVRSDEDASHHYEQLQSDSESTEVRSRSF